MALHLAKTFPNVTIFDQKKIDESGLPHFIQSHHVHLLNKRGVQLLQKLFPEIVNLMTPPHFIKLNFDQEVYWNGPLGKLSSTPSNLGELYFFDQKELIKLLWAQIKSTANIKIIEETKITKHLHLENRFLFSCLGRNHARGRSHSFLKVPSKLKYCSFKFKTNFFEQQNFKAIIHSTFGDLRDKGIVVIPISDQEYLMTQVARDFTLGPIEFLLSTDFPFKEQLANSIEPTTKPQQYAIGQGIYGRSLLKNGDPHVFILGDERISLNPIFGQGMCLSLEAINTIHELEQKDNLNSKSFNQSIRSIYDNAWSLGTSEDRILNSNFIMKKGYELIQKIVLVYLRKMQTNAYLYEHFMKVINMQIPFSQTFRFRVLKELWK